MDFAPDWTSPPGETIIDFLDEEGVSLDALAHSLSLSSRDIGSLLDGEMHITRPLAERLAASVGSSVSFWLAREANYRSSMEAFERRQWIETLPVRDMRRFGWIAPSVDEEAACLSFFGVSTVADWRVRYSPTIAAATFRMSNAYEAKPLAIAAWLRRGELLAASVTASEWDRGAFKDSLSRLRALTRTKAPGVFLPALREECARCGVVVVVERTPAGCPASGVTRFLTPTRALMMLSFRYLTDDQFWFTFFHEAGHIVLHRPDAVFLESERLDTSIEEREASAFAIDTLFPDAAHERLNTLRISPIEVMRMARKLGIAPGIIVGQLQRLGRVPQKHMNNLKVRYSWE